MNRKNQRKREKEMTSLLPLYPCDRCCFQPRLDSLMVQAPREHLGHLSLHLKADDQVNTISVHEWAERPNYRKHSLCVLWTHSQPPPQFLLPSKLISSAGRKSLKISGVRALKTSCFSSENQENLARKNNCLWHERGSGMWACETGW